MMMSILVCHSYFLALDRKQAERCKPYPPLATLQVVTLLRKAGYEVSFFDAMLAGGTADFQRHLQSVAPQVVLIYEDTFNFLTKMCLATMRNAACDMIGMARRAGATVIAAGPDVTEAPEPYRRAGADFTLAGEGLTTITDILSRISQGQAPQASPYEETAAWDLVDMSRYRAAWVKAHGYFSLNMAGSRGCSFRCTWCAKPTWGNQYLQRRPEDVAAEMALLKRNFAPDHVWFADDIFGFKVDWVSRFADALDDLGGGIPFTIQTRADLASERMVQQLHRAGCAEAWVGAESGSQRVLDAMNKGTSITEIVKARRLFGKAGIRVGFFIQLGYLGEGLADIIATRDLLTVARPDDIGVSVSYPLPGTRFYDAVKAQLGDKTRWDESDDLDMMFHGAYTSDFYRAVRRLLHDQVAARDTGIEERWQQLLSQEVRFRSAAAPLHDAVV